MMAPSVSTKIVMPLEIRLMRDIGTTTVKNVRTGEAPMVLRRLDNAPVEPAERGKEQQHGEGNDEIDERDDNGRR